MNLHTDESDDGNDPTDTLGVEFSIFDPENAALYAELSEELVTLNTECIPVLEFPEVNVELLDIESLAPVDDFDFDSTPVFDKSEGKSTSRAGKPHLFRHQSGSSPRVSESEESMTMRVTAPDVSTLPPYKPTLRHQKG